MGIQLKQLNIESVYRIPRTTYNLMMHTIQHAITSITLHSLLRVRNATKTLISTMALCRTLTHLNLGRQSCVPVEFLLNQCPKLIPLTLFGIMTRLNTVDNIDTSIHPSSHAKLH
jgi:hypothetical protein